MKGLTQRQQEIAEYINQFIKTHRYSPSYREIMHHFGFSSLGTVYRHINVLRRKGILNLEKGCSRSLAFIAEPHVVEEVKQGIALPLIGYLSAGSPIELFPQSRSIIVPESLVHAPEKTYVLRAVGDTLVEEMIGDGDLLLVEARQQAHAGETIVAIINQHETIVKRYFPEGVYIRLTSHYPHHHPLILREENLQIQGVLVSLLRHYG
jgi:repressor LexA